MINRKKYRLAIVSAELVGFIAILACGWVIKLFEIIPTELYENIYFVLFLTIGVMGIFITTMHIWGRVLCLLGYFSKNDAKGFPFAKHWK